MKIGMAIDKEKEEREKEQQQKEAVGKNKNEEPEDYFPPSPIYDPNHNKYALPHCDSKMKQALDPNYYPLNYVPKYGVVCLNPCKQFSYPTSKNNKRRRRRPGRRQKRRTMQEIQRRKKTGKKTRHRQTQDKKWTMMIIWTIQIWTLSIRKVTRKNIKTKFHNNL